METREFGEFIMLLSKLPEGAGVDPELVKHYANTVIEEIVKSYDFSRLQQTDAILTVAQYSTGTISIASGATAGMGTDTVFTAAMTGRRIRIASTSTFYTFTRVSATSFTIDRAYEDPTDVVDGAFRIWQAVYDLPIPLQRVKSIEVPSQRWDLDEKSREWLNRRDPERAIYGDPQVWVQAEDSSAGLPRVELYPGPETAESLPVEFQAKIDPLVETDDLIPEWFSIPALWAGTVAMLNGRPLDKEALFQSALTAMQNEDQRRKPPLEIQLADRFIEHRIARASRSRRGHWGTGEMW